MSSWHESAPIHAAPSATIRYCRTPRREAPRHIRGGPGEAASVLIPTYEQEQS